MATRNPSLNIVPSLKRNQTEVEAAAADAELRGARGDWWWTGPKPTACPGFDEEAGVLRYARKQLCWWAEVAAGGWAEVGVSMRAC
jgi:hypothetical protein